MPANQESRNPLRLGKSVALHRELSVRASCNRHRAHCAIVFAQHGDLGEVDRRTDVTRHE